MNINTGDGWEKLCHFLKRMDHKKRSLFKESQMWVQFNVSDRCTLKCKDCHWFSQDVKIVESISKDDVLFFINRWKPIIVQFSGGEPTLWSDLCGTINKIPSKIQVIVNSNGNRPSILANINRKIKLDLSVHKGMDHKLFEQSVKIARQKKFKLNFASFNYFNNPFGIEVNQANQMKNIDREKIGKKVVCKPTKIYFGSDGRAYQCEKGLRTKDDLYYAGFSVRSGIPNQSTIRCIVDKLCLTVGNEQEMEWI